MFSKTVELGLLCFFVLAGVHLAAAQLASKDENMTLCWGDGSYGQLGNGQGNFTSRVYNSSVPVEVLGNLTFASVCIGDAHSCALDGSGKAWCWGHNDINQLGDGTVFDSATPVAVAGNHTFRTITCGGWHNCALDKEGGAWCWGYNPASETFSLSVPAEVASGRSITAMCAGFGHTCALEADGRMSCWGNNEGGQLGAGLAASSSATPVEVAGDHTFQSITCGNMHTCALDEDGHAWCFGVGDFGRLGNGANNNQTSPVLVAGGFNFTSITAGASHTCAVTADLSLLCWGQSPDNGQYNYTNHPAEVRGHHSFVNISAGWGFTCGLDASGDVWCFGVNWFGTLGDGTHTPALTPVRVSSQHAFLTLGETYGGTICGITNKTARSESPSKNISASSGSVPIGALAGGIAAVVVAAALAFFALRPGKGWLRRKPPPAPLEDGSSSSKESPGQECISPAPLPGQQGSSRPLVGDLSTVSASPLPATEAAPACVEVDSTPAPELDTLLPSGHASDANPASHGALLPPSQVAEDSASVDTLLPFSRAADAPLVSSALEAPTAPSALPPSMDAESHPGISNQPGPQALPLSYLSSVGGGWAAGPAPPPAVASPAVALAAGQASSPTSSTYTPATDPMLSLIASYLGTHPCSIAQPGSPQHLFQPVLGSGETLGSGGTSSTAGTAGSGPLDLWEVQWPELTILRSVGHGSFGAVYLAEWKQIRVAVKVLVAREDVHRGQLELPDKVVRELQAEAAVMSRMRHPNILQFMGLVTVPPALITEYCSRGSLYDCLAAAREQPAAAAQLTWRRRLAMAVDAGAGLLYLHGRGIIHRDVKSPNMLIDDHWTVKVADFNLSKLLEGARPEASITSAAATNPIWLAPEVLDGDKATAASDVYSFGLVLYELLTWRLPWTFANMSPFKVGATIRQGGRPEVPPRDQLPGPDTAGWIGLDAYVQLMRDCWAQQPADRPTFDEVVGRLRRLLEETAGA